jgi:hypothetical protein
VLEDTALCPKDVGLYPIDDVELYPIDDVELYPIDDVELDPSDDELDPTLARELALESTTLRSLAPTPASEVSFSSTALKSVVLVLSDTILSAVETV